ncbi:MAG TPA: RAMP superfamily CRISPR-associated protein [Bryobacteraceae bacterium]|nr:RAMP superfamily CRISPR-associated protein [Bryobacteraceae bacterium]
MNDRIVKRYYATGVWESSSALHVGGESVGAATADMVLLRADDGCFYIPGPSLAGAARSALARRFAEKYDAFRDNEEPPIVRALFGRDHSRKWTGESEERERTGYASSLSVFDAPAVDWVEAAVRDGVRIDATNGIAVDGAKFDIEVLPAGARFRLRFTLSIFEEMPECVSEQDALTAFQAMLTAYCGEIRLGARTRRGYGEGAVHDWKIHVLDMSRPAHVKAWLLRRPELGDVVEFRAQQAANNMFTLDGRFQLRTSLLVRSASTRPGDPDTVQLFESGSAVLPGTSLAGAIRARCSQIAVTMLENDEVARAMIDSLFGPHHETDGPKEALRGGRVWVSEAHLGGERRVQGRVQIDRFTGGARESALFDEAPLWPTNGSQAQIRIQLEEPTDVEIGLLLLAFKDLWVGDLTLGGEASGGRGVFFGSNAVISAPDGRTWTLRATEQDPADVETDGDREALESFVTAFAREGRAWMPRPWEVENVTD